MMDCQLLSTDTVDSRGWVLLRCNRCNRRRFSPDSPEKTHGPCPAWPFWHEFGEWLALVLAAIGINPLRWAWLQRKLGLIEPNQSCNCNLYREWLNSFGGRLAASTHWLARFLAVHLIRRAK